jgi:Tfp pilus assembly protein PilO
VSAAAVRRRLARAVAAVFLLNAGGLAFHTLPRLALERSHAARLAALRDDVARERAAFAARRERVALRAANERDAARFREELLAPRSELDAVLRELERLSPSRESRSYRSDRLEHAGAERVTVSMPVKGSYAELRLLLARIESLDRFVTIDRVALREGDGSTAGLDVLVSAYFELERGS